MAEFDGGLYQFELIDNMNRERTYKQWYCRNESDFDGFIDLNKFNFEYENHQIL